jgi:hypothetical protein
MRKQAITLGDRKGGDRSGTAVSIDQNDLLSA